MQRAVFSILSKVTASGGFNKSIGSQRFSSALTKPKKFYKNVSIVKSTDGWEVNLDQRKLKTPAGKPLLIPNEALAAAVATEWATQKGTIGRHAMHLTALCNTAQDNPHNKTAEQLSEEIVEFLENDSLLFRMPRDEQPDLYDLQCRSWEPILEWFCGKHQIELQPSEDVISPEIPPVAMLTVYKDIFSYPRTALFGLQFGVECLKSLILMQAAVARRITVEEAVNLSRLETEYQTEKWGNVEWSHELDRQQVLARLSASVLFVQLSLETSTITHKKAPESA